MRLVLLLPPILPESASTVSGEVDRLYFLLLGVCGTICVIIAALIIFFAVKYREASPASRENPHPGSFRLEMGWTVTPMLIFCGFFFWGAKIYFENAEPPAGALDVYVVGKQWMWKVQHSNGRREINQLHIPRGAPVKLTMVSEDVIHDFFVPAFRVKQDVLPRRYTTLWFQPIRSGTYHLFCAEYCGTNHARMKGEVIVMEPLQYDRWLAGEPVPSVAGGAGPTESMAAAGARLFRSRGCVSCHGSSAEGTPTAPALAGLFGRTVRLQGGQTFVADESYLRDAILQALDQIVAGYQPVMPVYQGQLTEAEVMEIITFIKSLAPPESETSPASPIAPPVADSSPATPPPSAPAGREP